MTVQIHPYMRLPESGVKELLGGHGPAERSLNEREEQKEKKRKRRRRRLERERERAPMQLEETEKKSSRNAVLIR